MTTTDTNINSGYSSVQSIAEMIHGRVEPAQNEQSGYDITDIEEMVRNAYAGVVWKFYMQLLDSGDRTIIDPLLQRKRYKVEGNSVILEGMGVIDCPRDAGIYQVIPFDENNGVVGEPLTKTSAAGAYAPKSRIFPGYRYYRIGDTMYFPDGLPRCTVGVEVVFLGLLDEEVQKIPHDMADAVYDKVMQTVLPTKNIRSDITNNANPEE
jgi:hypothetical protein